MKNCDLSELCFLIVDPNRHMRGLEFIKEVRTNKRYPNPYVAVIMLTSYCERHHVIEARDAGVNEFLVKPISVKALYDRIVEVIEFSRSYVISSSFTGPCRRRSPDPGYIGPGRRQADREKEEAAAMSQDEVASKLGKKTDNWHGGPR